MGVKNGLFKGSLPDLLSLRVRVWLRETNSKCYRTTHTTVSQHLQLPGWILSLELANNKLSKGVVSKPATGSLSLTLARKLGGSPINKYDVCEKSLLSLQQHALFTVAGRVTGVYVIQNMATCPCRDHGTTRLITKHSSALYTSK